MKQIPPWVFVTVVCIGIVAVGVFGWKTLAGNSDNAGPPKQVRPGMYDLRAEAAKMRASKEAAPHGE